MKNKKPLSWIALRRLMEKFPVIIELADNYFKHNGVVLRNPIQQLRNLTVGNWEVGIIVAILLATILSFTIVMLSEPLDSPQHQNTIDKVVYVGLVVAGLIALSTWYREARFAKKNNEELWRNFREVVQNLRYDGAFGRVSVQDTMSSLSSVVADELRIRARDLHEVQSDLTDSRDPGPMRLQLKRRIEGYSAAGLANLQWDEYFPPATKS